MKQRVFLIAVVGVALSTFVVAAQSRASGAQPVSDAVRTMWAAANAHIRDSAVDVPEAVYTFSPVPNTVRTFGQIVGHVAGANYEFCSAAKGEKSPAAENAFESLATKAALLKAYDESAAYCEAVVKALTDRSAAETIDMPFGMGKAARVRAIMENVGHLNEHYGNLVTYMRMKGIVPPTSRGR
jgi:uncharacterized damage-inducible protein DinB